MARPYNSCKTDQDFNNRKAVKQFKEGIELLTIILSASVCCMLSHQTLVENRTCIACVCIACVCIACVMVNKYC